MERDENHTLYSPRALLLAPCARIIEFLNCEKVFPVDGMRAGWLYMAFEISYK